jgi:hypothetical protein
MDTQVARVPKLRIGEGAKPSAGAEVEQSKTPKFKSSDRGTKPRAKALDSEVNAIRKGKSNASAKSAGGFSAKRSAVRGKKK